MGDESRALLCPSSRCEVGARLIGVVKADGTVAFTPDEIRIDATFVSVARLGRKPEARFRFAGPCHRNNCVQWTNERCGVVDGVLSEIETEHLDTPREMPDCSIRPTCRWFRQSGGEACRACTLVVTEITPR